MAEDKGFLKRCWRYGFTTSICDLQALSIQPCMTLLRCNTLIIVCISYCPRNVAQRIC